MTNTPQTIEEMAKGIAYYSEPDMRDMVESAAVAVITSAIQGERERIIKLLPQILDDYTSWLCKHSYTDADVYAEEPKAADRFLAEPKALQIITPK